MHARFEVSVDREVALSRRMETKGGADVIPYFEAEIWPRHQEYLRAAVERTPLVTFLDLTSGTPEEALRQLLATPQLRLLLAAAAGRPGGPGGGVPAPCEAGCGRPSAWGYAHCCRTCKLTSTASHGPRCERRAAGSEGWRPQGGAGAPAQPPSGEVELKREAARLPQAKFEAAQKAQKAADLKAKVSGQGAKSSLEELKVVAEAADKVSLMPDGAKRKKKPRPVRGASGAADSDARAGAQPAAAGDDDARSRSNRGASSDGEEDFMDSDGWEEQIKGLIHGELQAKFSIFQNEVTELVTASASKAASSAVDPVMAAIKGVEAAVQQVPQTCKSQLEAQLRPELDATQRRLQLQIDTIQSQVRDIDTRTETLATDMEQLKSLVDELRKELAVANRPPPPPKPTPGFNRAVGGTILKVVAPAFAKKCDFQSSVDKWLKGASIDGFTILGDEQGKLFTIQFNGAVGTAGKKVAAALSALRLPGKGQWMRFPIPAASGGSTQLHIGPDKNPFQVKMEITGRVLKTWLVGSHSEGWFNWFTPRRFKLGWIPFNIEQLSNNLQFSNKVRFMGKDALSDQQPILVALDFGQAFPSLSQQYLFTVLKRLLQRAAYSALLPDMMRPFLSIKYNTDSPLVVTSVKRWSKWFPSLVDDLTQMDWKCLQDKMATYPTAWASALLRGLCGGWLTTCAFVLVGWLLISGRRKAAAAFARVVSALGHSLVLQEVSFSLRASLVTLSLWPFGSAEVAIVQNVTAIGFLPVLQEGLAHLRQLDWCPDVTRVPPEERENFQLVRRAFFPGPAKAAAPELLLPPHLHERALLGAASAAASAHLPGEDIESIDADGYPTPTDEDIESMVETPTATAAPVPGESPPLGHENETMDAGEFSHHFGPILTDEEFEAQVQLILRRSRESLWRDQDALSPGQIEVAIQYLDENYQLSAEQRELVIWMLHNPGSRLEGDAVDDPALPVLGTEAMFLDDGVVGVDELMMAQAEAESMEVPDVDACSMHDVEVEVGEADEDQDAFNLLMAAQYNMARSLSLLLSALDLILLVIFHLGKIFLTARPSLPPRRPESTTAKYKLGNLMPRLDPKNTKLSTGAPLAGAGPRGGRGPAAMGSNCLVSTSIGSQRQGQKYTCQQTDAWRVPGEFEAAEAESGKREVARVVVLLNWLQAVPPELPEPTEQPGWEIMLVGGQ
ncbi:unnamed protein product [Prorocentrum cordatum]|uniref:Reverse transcriptase domain-containing protein n=1 Tax=Prorocentrum cordatum TaxID=2364126 RepID=A0ABN9PD30_9DINO|nr:unnamed protein product [Polarella glacialis]